MRPLFGHDTAVAAWVGGRMEHIFAPPYTAIGFLDENTKLIGGAVFTQYNRFNIEATIYGPGALSRDSVQTVMRYVFAHLECERLTARTRRGNHTMRAILPRIGFKQEGLSPRYYGRSKADDAFIFGLRRERAAKWIAENGRLETPRSAQRSSDSAAAS